MKISAIICEFNPFHNGHKHLLDSVKSNKDDIVVCVMSGNFTQRGDVAVISKYARAKQAVHGGADIVIELPTVYACSSASVFAKAGVEIAAALGCVDTLSFGCECGSADLILRCADAVSNPIVIENTDRRLKNGEYFPRALQTSVNELYGEELAQVLSNPNNTLAVEYCKALKNTAIKPYAVKRVNVSHDSCEAVDDFASAAHIRNMLENKKDVQKFLPYYNKSDFENLHTIKNLERVIMYKLRGMSKQDFEKLPEVMQGLENRIYECVRKYNCVEEIIGNIKTKRYTHSRLRRIMIYSLLGITKEMQNEPVPYLRVLAFNEKGAKVMSSAKKAGKLPIITKLSKEYGCLYGNGRDILDVDLRAADIFTLAGNTVTSCGEDYLTGTLSMK